MKRAKKSANVQISSFPVSGTGVFEELFTGQDDKTISVQRDLQKHVNSMLRYGRMIDIIDSGNRYVPTYLWNPEEFNAQKYGVDVAGHLDFWSDAKKVAEFSEQFKGKVDGAKEITTHIRDVSEGFEILYGDKGIGDLARGVGSIAGKVERGLGIVGKWAGLITKPYGYAKDAVDVGSKTIDGAYSGRGGATPEQIDHFFDGSEEGEEELRRFKSSRPYNRFGGGANSAADEIGRRAADEYDPANLFHKSPTE